MKDRINLSTVYGGESYLEKQGDNTWKLNTDAKGIKFHNGQLDIGGTQALVEGDVFKGHVISAIEKRGNEFYVTFAENEINATRESDIEVTQNDAREMLPGEEPSRRAWAAYEDDY
jgi:hypothetical protein